VRRFLRRLGLGLLLVVLVVVGSGIGAVAFLTGRALPQVAGRIEVAGLGAPVEVVRDVNGVVHITADTPHNLFLAQGYVHAQERLWQMEVWRHVSYGRLSELFGPTQLRTDRFIRTLGWRAAAERNLAAMPADVRAALDAYAEGVNAYLDTRGGLLGLAFVVAGLRSGDGPGGYRPERWTPLDSMTWSKVQAWNLSGNFESEVFRLLADARLGDPALTDRLLPEAPGGSPVIVASGPATGGVRLPRSPAPAPAASVIEWSAEEQAGLIGLLAAASGPSAAAGLDAAGGLGAGHGIGSNSWVVAPSRSATGDAMLANDPHLAAMMPSIWFLNGLHCRAVTAACPFNVAGVSFPGVPAVVLGHNARIAWGATNANPDVQDLYLETIDPADPGRYLFKGESRPFETREERIRVAGAPDDVLTVRSTVHGPVLNDVEHRLRDAPVAIALRWPAIESVDRTVEAIFRVNTASDWDDFRAALSIFGGPSQNFVYADANGHIGYQLPGAIPIRAAGDRGDRPVPGADGDHEWSGLVRFEDLPTLFDPPEGLIVTANNAITEPGAGWPFLGREVDPGYRAQRALDLLAAGLADDGISVDEMATIQVDSAVLRAPLVVAGLARAEPQTDDGRLLLERIRAWDGRCPIESRGCAAYMAAEYRLLRDAFDGRLGLDLARDYVGTTMSWQALIDFLAHPDDAWRDEPATPTRETAPAVIAASLDRAASELRDAFGAPHRWTWGRMHTATFQEGSLGTSGIGPLEWYFNAGPYPAPGAAGALNAAYYRFRRAYPDPAEPEYVPVPFREVFAVTNLPSFRQVVDLGRLDEARVMITTGNAGNPFDRHYGDLVDEWLAGETIQLRFSPGAIRSGAVSTLVLAPPAP